jgi:hypothetical protein
LLRSSLRLLFPFFLLSLLLALAGPHLFLLCVGRSQASAQFAMLFKGSIRREQLRSTKNVDMLMLSPPSKPCAGRPFFQGEHDQFDFSLLFSESAVRCSRRWRNQSSQGGKKDF